MSATACIDLLMLCANSTRCSTRQIACGRAVSLRYCCVAVQGFDSRAERQRRRQKAKQERQRAAKRAEAERQQEEDELLAAAAKVIASALNT